MKPKPKTVKAWAFALGFDPPCVQVVNAPRNRSEAVRLTWRYRGVSVGPVVRIEVPAPKETKR